MLMTDFMRPVTSPDPAKELRQQMERLVHIEAVLELSPATYREIRAKLIKWGAGGAFHQHPQGGELIDLTGVAICPMRH